MHIETGDITPTISDPIDSSMLPPFSISEKLGGESGFGIHGMGWDGMG